MSMKLTFQTAQYSTLLNDYNSGVEKIKNYTEEINTLKAENWLLQNKIAETPDLNQQLKIENVNLSYN